MSSDVLTTQPEPARTEPSPLQARSNAHSSVTLGRKRGRPSNRNLLLPVESLDRLPSPKAAAYMRMSTDHQALSIACQREAIWNYATLHNLEITRVFTDEACSGLNLQGRKALQQLLEEVVAGRAQYRTILVYDVSRWGRFQDVDESAYYEYLCRFAGINVVYCMEPFVCDASPISSVLKTIKRVMAGEYSRELSNKVWTAKCKVVEMGFFPGGPPPYGMRRMVVNRQGKQLGVLEQGEYKFRQEDRVTLVPGPPEEVKVVRRVFEMACSGLYYTEIAQRLNRQNIAYTGGKRWTDNFIRSMLGNEKYLGNMVYGMSSTKLKSSKKAIDEALWKRADGVFEPIITAKRFQQVQQALAKWPTRITNKQALDMLRRLLKKHGRLSAAIINRSPDNPRSEWFSHRFGQLNRAYALVGYEPRRSYAFANGFAHRLRRLDQFRQEVIAKLREAGAHVEPKTRVLYRINRKQMLAVKMAYCKSGPNGPSWVVQMHERHLPDWSLIARMSADSEVLDYWLIGGDYRHLQLNLPRRRSVPEYRSNSLDDLLKILVKGLPKMSALPEWQAAAFSAKVFRQRETPNQVSLIEAMIPVLRGHVMRGREIAAKLISQGYCTKSGRFERMVCTAACSNPQLFRRVGGCWYNLVSEDPHVLQSEHVATT